MKKVLLIGCVGLPVVLLLILIIAYIALPSEFDVESSIVVNAPVEKIYPLVNTPNRWPEWTVWTPENYPTMVTTYNDVESGVGAGSSWTEEQGNGSMEIVNSDPQKGIDFKLEFVGFGESEGRVHFEPAEGGTTVRMGLKGEMPGIWKLGLPLWKGVMEDEYRQNLEKLKTVIEAQ